MAKPPHPTVFDESTRQAVRLPELAFRLSVCERTAYNLVSSGQIRSIKVRGLILIPLAAIDEFLAGDRT